MRNFYFNNGVKQSSDERMVKKVLFVLVLLMAVVLSGCASKKPEIITQTEFKDVFTPVKCDASMPSKPKYDPANPVSAAELGKYYGEVEGLLKECIGQ